LPVLFVLFALFALFIKFLTPFIKNSKFVLPLYYSQEGTDNVSFSCA